MNIRYALLPSVLACALVLTFAQFSRADIQGVWSQDSPGVYEFAYKVTNLEDFDQVRNALPNCGLMYCVPTSSMNMMAYAANHGFPAISPGPGNWQSNQMYGQATAALSQIGASMFTSATSGTNRSDWYFALKGSPFHWPPLIPQNQFTVSAFFRSGPKFPRLYQAGQTAIMTNGLIALCHGWYSQSGTLGGLPVLTRNGGHCLTIQSFGGYWHKGTSNYAGKLLLRDPGADEGSSGGGTCGGAFNPFAQSQFISNKYSLGLVKAYFPQYAFLVPIDAERMTFQGDTDMRLIDAYLVISPKGGYGFTNDPEPLLIWLLPLQFNGTNVPTVQAFKSGLVGMQDVVISPDLNSFFISTQDEIYEYNPLADDVVQILPGKLDNLAAFTIGRNRAIYAVHDDLLSCISLNFDVPFITAEVLLPNPCSHLVYDDASDFVTLLSQQERKLIRYPHHLDAQPLVTNVPGEVPLQGDVSMAINTVDSSLWISLNTFTTVFKMTFDPDGNVIAEAYPIPNAGQPPQSLEVDDAGHLMLNIGGKIREFRALPDGELLEVIDSPFAGMPGGVRFKVTHSRSNYDEAIHSQPEWLDAPPTQFAPQELACVADIAPADGGDGQVNVQDLLAVINAWGPCANCVEDFLPTGGDGSVNVTELLAVINNWGTCLVLDTPLIEDACLIAQLVHNGSYEFDTSAATTDGPPLPATCNEGFGLSLEKDIWMLYIPEFNGSLVVSTCNQAGFDTRMAAYTGSCGNWLIIGCNDDWTGCGLTSRMVLNVTTGTPVLIRLGGFGGASGTGIIQIGPP